MGIYLYGIKKLKKPHQVVREDGQVATVAHVLSFVSKPYWGFYGISDRYSKMAMGRIHRTYGDRFQGFVLYGTSIVKWDGPPTWLDGGDFSKGCVEWGVATDLHEVSDRSEDDHLATLSRARLPSLVAVVDGVRRTFEQYFRRNSNGSQPCAFAVRLNDGTVEFRNGMSNPVRVTGNDAKAWSDFRAFCLVTGDMVEEQSGNNRQIAVPAAALPPPAPTQEEMMRAAGWI